MIEKRDLWEKSLPELLKIRTIVSAPWTICVTSLGLLQKKSHQMQQSALHLRLQGVVFSGDGSGRMASRWCLGRFFHVETLSMMAWRDRYCIWYMHFCLTLAKSFIGVVTLWLALHLLKSKLSFLKVEILWVRYSMEVRTCKDDVVEYTSF